MNDALLVSNIFLWGVVLALVVVVLALARLASSTSVLLRWAP